MIPVEDLTAMAAKRITELKLNLVEAFPSTEKKQQDYKERKFRRLIQELLERHYG
jgi:hypothetical protein